MTRNILLEVEDLHVRFPSVRGDTYPLQGVNLSVRSGEVIGLVGESGCGKSLTARAILGLLPNNACVERGKVLLHRGDEVTELTALPPKSKQLRSIRWQDIAIIFQEPASALSSVHTVGNQIEEVLRLHQRLRSRAARERVLELFELVGLPRPRDIYRAYPFELSGGMRQRAVIAMALACEPRLLIADEPTTALDVTLQAQILDLLCTLQEKAGMAILLITHDMSVIANVADRVAVMYLGKVVEVATTRSLFEDAKHPYTQALLNAIPHSTTPHKTFLTGISGSVPSLASQYSYCGFQPRCEKAITGLCEHQLPDLITFDSEHQVACFLHSSRSAANVHRGQGKYE